MSLINILFRVIFLYVHVALGAVICQNDKAIAFKSRKMNPAQVNYTTTESKLLSMVETLKEFRNIQLGHQINLYTGHTRNKSCNGDTFLRNITLS